MLEVMMVDEVGAARCLAFDPDRVRLFTNMRPQIIAVLTRQHAQRRHAEAFIEQTYTRAYGGCIQSHYPIILSLRNVSGKVIGAAGARFADTETLFFKQYLQRPIEVELERAGLGRATRQEIVEIGNLTSDAQGASIFLFVALADYLKRKNCPVAVATATSRLRRIFKLVGIGPHQLARANASALPDGGATWGTYYRTDPVVLAGSIAEAHSRLCSLLTPGRPPAAVTRFDCVKDPGAVKLATVQA